jgi:hypothetical protein
VVSLLVAERVHFLNILFPVPTLRRFLELEVLKAAIVTRQKFRDGLNWVRLHSRAIMTTVCVVGLTTITVVLRHAILSNLKLASQQILKFSQGHPHLLRILHVTLFAVPDFAYVLLALAGLSYLMPDFAKKIEKTLLASTYLFRSLHFIRVAHHSLECR